jgi:hypothetical protein
LPPYSPNSLTLSIRISPTRRPRRPLRRGEFLQVSDQAVNGLRLEQVLAAEGAQRALDDAALAALTLDDVDVLVGPVAPLDALGSDVHVGSTLEEVPLNVKRAECCHYVFFSSNRSVAAIVEFEPAARTPL